MNSIISALYHGELRPEEQDVPCSARMDILKESFAINRERLLRQLELEPKEWLEELLQIHDDILNDTAFGNFYMGFVLGGRIVMEISAGEKAEMG